jgi:hypothetical protein
MEAEKHKLVGRCYGCQWIRWRLREWFWTTEPGIGNTRHFCRQCWDDRPKGWEASIGMSFNLPPGAVKVGLVGEPRANHEGNAFGSILMEYDDGTRLGFTCEHGGSMWLCLECARKGMERQSRRQQSLLNP